jgi:F-type H+-transporting ATPase subunit b
MLIRLNFWLAILLVTVVCLAVSPLAGAEHKPASGHETGQADGEPLNANPLTFKADLAIWTFVVFLILLLVLWRFAWGPIADGLQKRESGIAEDIAGAARINEEAKQLLADYQQKLDHAADDVRQLLEQARRDATDISRQIVEKARSEAEGEHQRALREIERATTAALKELAERSATLAVDLAGRIVSSRLDPRAHSELIRQAVERFSRTKTNGH